MIETDLFESIAREEFDCAFFIRNNTNTWIRMEANMVWTIEIEHEVDSEEWMFLIEDSVMSADISETVVANSNEEAAKKFREYVQNCINNLRP